MEPGGNHQPGALAEMSNTTSRGLPTETEKTTATAPSPSNTPTTATAAGTTAAATATAASSAEPHANNTPKSLDAETTTDKVQVSSTTQASGTDDDEWVWSNGIVANTPAADRDELRHSDAGSGDCGGSQVGAAAAAEHEAVSVDALESSSSGSSVNDVAANLSGSTNNSTPTTLLPTTTKTSTTTTTTIERASPEQHLQEIPMESNSSTTDYKLDNNDLLSSDTDINQVSTPVLGSATDRTLNMLSTQIAGLSMSTANPDSVPSDISNSLAPVPDEPELNDISPPTPRKDDNNNNTITSTGSNSRSPISPALLQTLPLPQPPPAPPPKDVPPKDRVYLDPASLTPGRSRSVSPTRDSSDRELPRNPRSGSSSEDDEPGDNTRSEIHNIFEQSNEKSSTSLASSGSQPPIMHPIRSSSLSNEGGKPADTTSPGQASQQIPQAAVTPTPNAAGKAREEAVQSPIVPQQQQPPPPPPDEDLPFDFHRFLRQLRKGSADPVAKFLSSFLREFAKKQWMVHEQVKIVHDFLNFIYGKMENCDVWRDVGEVEMDNAREGMEKLVMNRLYTQTFSPEILQASPPSAGGSRRTPSDDMFPGRRGQHQEDVERDEVLAQKVRIYGWIREEHLDIGDTVRGDGGRKFLDLAVNEMVKIKNYRAPRDKVICVLNCCKVIFGLLRHSNSDESADKFIPLLIYVVLRANPEHLVSNVQYILRFRNPDKLNGEAGYYLSSLMGAIQFIENLDRSSLTITDEEFERNVEAAVAAIAERPPPSPPQLPPRRQSSYNTEAVSEKGRRSTEGRSSTSSNDSSSGESDEKAAVAGLLRTIQRPLTTIGRIFSDGEPANATLSLSSNSGPALTPRGRSPSAEDSLLTAVGGRGHSGRRKPAVTAEEAAARQASAETEEARRIQRNEHETVVDILKAMFPALDKEIIADVVSMKEGRSVSSPILSPSSSASSSPPTSLAPTSPSSYALALSLFVPFRFVSRRYLSFRKGRRLRKILGGTV